MNTYDTFATACYVLGIPLNYRIDGKPIHQIFDNQELLLSSFEPSMRRTDDDAGELRVVCGHVPLIGFANAVMRSHTSASSMRPLHVEI